MLSVVIPLYNEEELIAELARRLKEASAAWGDYEIIFVDDGSKDQTGTLLKRIIAQTPGWRLVQFSRNFGHQAAVSAGLAHARGDGVVVIDGDLQDPPELISTFLEKWREGHEVVYAVRAHRREHLVKRVAYSLFYRLLRRLAQIDIPLDAGDFCLMDRRVVDAINAMPERNRFIRGLRAWSGFISVGVPYARAQRYAGEPKYTFRKLFRLAFDGLTGFSSAPLKFTIYIGFVIAFTSFLAGLFIIVRKLIFGIDVRGWSSLIVVVFFMGGMQLFIMGVLGEYIGRIYTEVQGRPLYIVKEKYGFE